MTLYFITGNSHKFAEVQAMLPHIEQLKLDLPEIQETNAKLIIEAKLQEARKYHDGEFIVEDTGLYLDCLHGLPGPLIKRFVESIGDQGIRDIAQRAGNTCAIARDVIGYCNQAGEIHYVEGIVHGQLVAPKAPSEFGRDAIFQPDGYTQTYADMPKSEKNQISHRRKAIDALQLLLQ